MATAICPSCDKAVNLSGDPEIGQRITCPSCQTELEVIDVEPVELDWAYDYDDDWDDDEDWDDDDM
jgi:alpha-aminoadipate carrier protein LysW